MPARATMSSPVSVVWVSQPRSRVRSPESSSETRSSPEPAVDRQQRGDLVDRPGARQAGRRADEDAVVAAHALDRRVAVDRAHEEAVVERERRERVAARDPRGAGVRRDAIVKRSLPWPRKMFRASRSP